MIFIDEFAIVEAFTSPEAGDSHVQTDPFKDFMVWFPEVIAQAPQTINTQVPGWSTMSEFE